MTSVGNLINFTNSNRYSSTFCYPPPTYPTIFITYNIYTTYIAYNIDNTSYAYYTYNSYDTYKGSNTNNIYTFDTDNIYYNNKTNNSDNTDNIVYYTEEIINFKNKSEILRNIINFLIREANITIIDNGYDIEINVDNILIAFSSTYNQKYNENKNKATINLGECENILKKEYNISYNNSLYIIKLDIQEEGMKIPIIEYELYYPLYNKKLSKLDLNLCKDTKIDISIPVTINDNIDKYNLSSDYYNSICSKASSKNKTDITLNDRKNEFINKNMTLCEENCDLIEYDYDNKKAKCSCLIKINIPLIETIQFDK